MKKITTAKEAVSFVAKLKSKGKKIVLAGGCFDLLHIGHIAFFKKAKAEGDILILFLESDEAIKKSKGKKRPINSQNNRAEVLSAVEFVDFVIPLPKPFTDADYDELVAEISPDVIAVTSGDANLDNKNQQAKKVGGVVKVVLKQIPEHSTTKLLNYF